MKTNFGPGVKITSAEMPADVESFWGGTPDPAPPYCEAKGIEAPANGFIIKMPTKWNGNYFQGGNGALAGHIELARVNTGLMTGCAAAGADGGHAGEPVDGTFGYNPPDNSNPDAAAIFAALVDWVEKKVAPGAITGVNKVRGKVVRSRPMCPYPQVVRCKGSGSIDDAANFTCAVPD